MKKMIMKYTTSGAGAATVNGERSVLGKLYAVEYRPGTTDTACTLTLTCTEWNAVSKPLLIKASPGTSDVWYYPRDIPHGVEDGAVLTATAGGDRVLPLLAGVPRLVVSAGGDTMSGTMIIYWEQ